jgi:hypothetical protein
MKVRADRRQLVRAGEDVVDVPATLAARVRLLGSGRGSKSDPNELTARHRGYAPSTQPPVEVTRKQMALELVGDIRRLDKSIAQVKKTTAAAGNRQLNHALHMAAVTQISHDTPALAYYQRKTDTDGKSASEARRALKRRISDAVYRQLRADTHT